MSRKTTAANAKLVGSIRRVQSRHRGLARSALPVELQGMYDRYRVALGSYMRTNRLYWQKTLKLESGTLSNLEGGLAFFVLKLAGLASSSANEAADAALKAGCTACQDETHRVLTAYVAANQQKDPRLSAWKIQRYVVGWGMEHHAVAVHQANRPVASGYVFDPWIRQEPEVYTYNTWEKLFRALRQIGKARPE